MLESPLLDPDSPSRADGPVDAAWLERVFPFCFVLTAGRIVRAGPGLRALLPTAEGTLLIERMRAAPPWGELDDVTIGANLDRLVELREPTGVALRGQFTRAGEAIIFLGGPVMSVAALRERGLEGAVRAAHDATGALVEALTQRDAARARVAALRWEIERRMFESLRQGSGRDVAPDGSDGSLRAQLGAVVGTAGLLSETALTDEQRRLVSVIRAQARAAAGQVERARPRTAEFTAPADGLAPSLGRGSAPTLSPPPAVARASVDAGLRRRIANLTEQAGAEVTVAIVEMFLVDAAATLDDLADAADRGHPGPVARLAQALRGSANNVGAAALADAAAALERTARTGGVGRAPRMVVELRGLADDVFAVLRSLSPLA